MISFLYQHIVKLFFQTLFGGYMCKKQSLVLGGFRGTWGPYGRV